MMYNDTWRGSQMICNKCGAELNDNAVFCDKCGCFVLREETESEPLEAVGKRVRSRGAFWLFFRITAWILIIAAGITATLLTYRMVKKQTHDKMYRTPEPTQAESVQSTSD